MLCSMRWQRYSAESKLTEMTDRVEIKKGLVAKNSASFFVTYILNITVLVWLHQYLLRRVSIEEYSLYAVIAAVIAYAPLLEVMIVTGLIRYAVEAYAVGDQRRVTQIASSAFSILMILGPITLVCGLIFAWNIDHVLTVPKHLLMDARLMMALLMFSFSIRLMISPFWIGLHIRQKFVLNNLIRLGGEALRLTFLFILLFMISTKVLWVVVASVIGSLGSLTAMTLVSRHLVPALKFRRDEIKSEAKRKLIHFGLWNFVASSAFSIRNHADIIILNKLSTPLDVACFNLGRLCYRQPLLAWGMVRQSIFPVLTAMHATDRKESLRNTYLRGGRYALWIVLLIATPIIIFRNEIIRLYVGPEYLLAASVILILLLAFPVELGNILVTPIARARGMIKPLAVRVIVIQSVNLVLTIILVGQLRMGAVGSALATLLIMLLFEPLLMWPLGFKLVDVRLERFLRETFFPGILPAVLYALLLIVLRWLVQPSTWMNLLVCAAIGCVFYLASLYKFCLQSGDKKDLEKLLRRRKP
jgi:O-antigen/teichoic acid export membrane protein